MRQGFIKTAAATPKVVVADCKANGQEIFRLVKEMEKEHAKIMVFPELCITGYTCGDLFSQRCLIESAWETVRDLAEKTRETDALIFVGAPVRHKGKLFNTAVVMNRGEILGIVPKSYLPNYGEFYEQRNFSPAEEMTSWIELPEETIPFGNDLLFVSDVIPELTVAAEICEDLWVPNPPSINHALNGAHIIVNLSASNEMVGKESYRKSLVQGQSARLVCGYVYANAGEGESTQDLVFGGQNLIAENGTLLAEGRRFSNEIVYGEIDVHKLADTRRRMSTFPASGDNSVRILFHVETEETTLTRKISRFPFVPEDEGELCRHCEEILNIQAMGLKKRMEHIHCTKAMVGLSGGLDSTLALLAVVRTFDRMELPHDQIHCVTMPCFGTTDRTYQNACRLSACLGAKLSEIPIKDAVNVHFRDIGHNSSVHDVTYENSQARERTQVLMDLSNQEGSILVGTGDLSELALGWATYNGDHMSMYGVNGSIPKTLVRHLVRYCAENCQEEELKEVLLDILDTPVSPELLPPGENGEIAQKTEDLVGPYELHDFYLYYMLRAGFEPKKIYRLACLAFEEVYDRETIKKWLKRFYWRFFGQQFKRSCLPDGPKVGSVSVSPRGDLRMPSDASARIWLDQLDTL